MRYFLIIMLILSAKSCNDKKNNTVATAHVKIKDSIQKTKVPEISKEETLILMNTNLLKYLKTKSFNKMASYIHPTKGVRFSMYAFVNPDQDKVFSQEEFLEYLPRHETFTWGSRDGTGETYQTPLQNYLTDWVWQKDFTQSKYELNGKISYGNSKDNAKEIYPNADITVNFLPGTAQYSQMDWQTLSFVFEEYLGRYYLSGVINDQWTT